MDTETPSDDRPNIQIDDLVRPMTDEEYAEWLEMWETRTPVTPIPDISVGE